MVVVAVIIEVVAVVVITEVDVVVIIVISVIVVAVGAVIVGLVIVIVVPIIAIAQVIIVVVVAIVVITVVSHNTHTYPPTYSETGRPATQAHVRFGGIAEDDPKFSPGRLQPASAHSCTSARLPDAADCGRRHADDAILRRS